MCCLIAQFQMFLILRLQIWLDSAGNQPAKKKTQQFLRDYTDIGGGGVNGYKQIIFDYKKHKTENMFINHLYYRLQRIRLENIVIYL